MMPLAIYYSIGIPISICFLFIGKRNFYSTLEPWERFAFIIAGPIIWPATVFIYIEYEIKKHEIRREIDREMRKNEKL